MSNATTENFSLEMSDSANAAKHLMNEQKPTSLLDAFKQDINDLLPTGEKAVANRERAKKFGYRTLVVAGVAFAAVVGFDYVAPPVEVGSVVTTQNQGDGLSNPIVSGLEQISDSTGINVNGADYRDGVADLAKAGVGDGYAGLNIEVTAYKSPILGRTSVSAQPAEINPIDTQLPTK